MRTEAKRAARRSRARSIGRARRRRAKLVLAACLALAAAARAQEPPGRLPEGTATLRGRIVHEGGGEVAGLPVVLYAAREGGAPGLARTVSDASGGFAFEGVSNDPAIAYLVGVRAEELPFGTRVAFEPGELVRELEVRVSPPTPDASAVVREGARLRIDRGCRGLRVIETHRLRNPGPRAVFVPGERREGAAAALTLELPAGASPLVVPFASQGLEQEGSAVRFWGPLPPGEHEIEFSYSVPAPGATVGLGWRLPQGVRRLEVLTEGGAVRASGGGLAPGEAREIEGRSYALAAGGPLAPGATLDLRLELGQVASSPLEWIEAETRLELDDAALAVDESHRLSAGAPLAARPEAPLLCLALPPGAEDLRFSEETLAMGAEPDPSGGLALRGPIPAGESTLALRYRVPVAGGPVELRPRFDRPVRLLRVFVADTGVAAESPRLHRRRSVQSADRSYLHLEGFEIGAGEEVAIHLSRLAPRRPAPRLAALGFSAALAAVALAFLAGPLRGGREEAGAEPALAQLDSEREALVAALRGLEEDFETGKLDAPDYDELRSELRARTAELIERRSQLERELARGPRPAGAAPAPACAACAAPLPADARFCHRCGARVEPAGELD
jgi:hypothetical protein